MRLLVFIILVSASLSKILSNLGGDACTATDKCGKCEGDCDSDNDCAAGLKCFKRSNSAELVPGCGGVGGDGDDATTDYCYEPCPPHTTASAGCTGQLSSVLAASGSEPCGISEGSLNIWVNTAIATNELYDITSNADMTMTGDLMVNGAITSTGTIQANARSATTAGKLQTKRSIGGVDFDGTQNIQLPGVDTAGTMDTSGNAATATKLQTKRSIGGVDFDGTHSIDLPGVNKRGNQGTSGTASYADRAHMMKARTGFHGGANGIAPNQIPSNTVQVAFTNWATYTWNQGWADAIFFNTYYDGTGSNVNILKLRKQSRAMRIEQGSFGSGSDVRDYSNVQLSSGSDARLKTNVQTIEDPLTKITKLRGVNFEWKKRYVTHISNQTSKFVYNDAYDEGLQMGFIAQEVEQVIPEVIERDHIGFEGLDDVLALDYPKITALLVEGIKELNEKVRAQEGTIATLSSVIEAMTVRLAALESK